MWRSRGAGKVETASMNVTVQALTTTSKTTTKTSTATTTATTTSTSTVDTNLIEEESLHEKPDRASIDSLIDSVENTIKFAESVPPNDIDSIAKAAKTGGIIFIIIFFVGGVSGTL